MSTNSMALKHEIQTVEDADYEQSDDEITQVAGHGIEVRK